SCVDVRPYWMAHDCPLRPTRCPMADHPRTRADARRRRGERPRGRRGRPAGGRRGRRGILRTLLLAFAAFVALGIAAVVIAYLVIDVPEPNDQAVAQASVLYYSDGETEM